MVTPTTAMGDEEAEDNNYLKAFRPPSSSSPSTASSASTLVDIDLDDDDDDDDDNDNDNVDDGVKKRNGSVSKRGSIQASILDSIERFSKKYR